MSRLALLVASAFFMEFLDGTIIVTALPSMAVSLGTAAVDLHVGISAYLLTVAVFEDTTALARKPGLALDFIVVTKRWLLAALLAPTVSTSGRTLTSGLCTSERHAQYPRKT